MIVVTAPADRLEDVVRTADDLLDEAPAGAEDQEVRRRRTRELRADLGERGTSLALARARRDQRRPLAGLPLDLEDRLIEVGDRLDERERDAAGLVVGGAEAALPVIHDLLGKQPQRTHGRGYEEAGDVVRLADPR